jgi:hypothetical protein
MLHPLVRLELLDARYSITLTSTAKIHRMVQVAQNTSTALETLPDGGRIPAELGPSHLDAITAAIRPDLELARQEIRRLRGERDELRRHLQGTLGKELINLSAAHSTPPTRPPSDDQEHRRRRARLKGRQRVVKRSVVQQ